MSSPVAEPTAAAGHEARLFQRQWEPERSLLVVAHPGHELRIHGWLERARPGVCVLTDGSGSAGASRLRSTAAVLQAARARPAPLFGRYRDVHLYSALLAGDHAPFVAMAGELLVLLRSARVDCVVADARDGYNPMHDVCRLLVDHVLLRLRDEGRPLLSFGFALVGPPEPAALSAPVARIDLDESAHRRKLEAACGYPELEGEVAAALRSCGADALRHEYLSLASYDRPDAAPDGGAKPYYETYGERQVAAGRYATVLRYERHVRPLVETLAREAGR